MQLICDTVLSDFEATWERHEKEIYEQVSVDGVKSQSDLCAIYSWIQIIWLGPNCTEVVTLW